MGTVPVQRDSMQSYALPADAALALASLSPADLRRAELIARARATGLRGMDWRDLLHEATCRILEGTRRWPTDISMIAFLAQTMRSISSDNRRREEHEVDGVDLEGSASAQRTDDGLDAVDRVERLQTHFADDANVVGLLNGLLAGETAKDTQGRLTMSPQDYDAARKRFWRGVARLIGEWE